MKHLILFEKFYYGNIYGIYYLKQFEKISDKVWSEISVTRDTIKFKAGDKSYAVYFEGFCRDENDLMLEDTAKSKFINKFKVEFAKKPKEYLEEFKKTPKILGDIDIYLGAEKFNL